MASSRSPPRRKPSPATKYTSRDRSPVDGADDRLQQLHISPNDTSATPKSTESKSAKKATGPKATASSKSNKTTADPESSRSHNAPSDEDKEDSRNESTKVKLTPLVDTTEMDRCAICMDDCTEPKQLHKCAHTFCTSCIDHYFKAVKPQCPCCFTIYGDIRGNQPENGTMTIVKVRERLPGYGKKSNGTIQITYSFPSGIQDERHPSPGQRYHGTSRTAYLPDNRDGQHVLKLLERAFALRQVFTIGQSRTTGCDNVVTWNDIHHKTSLNGGVENFGYPDETYLNRVQQELAAKGIH